MVDTQYVIFRLGEELYGAPIRDIQEIILPQKPVRVPNNPDFIEGVVEYRDNKLIPILDLKKRFRLGAGGYGRQSRLIIAIINDSYVAFIVDEVTEILRAQEKDIKEAPEVTRIGKKYIYGATNLKGQLIVLLKLSKVLSVDEKDILDAM